MKETVLFIFASIGVWNVWIWLEDTVTKFVKRGKDE